jgi:ATP-dependent protease HslVU (ClpYQ) peptidase subunit
MTTEIAFLYEAAAKLRAIATAVPDLAEGLRQMAEELEEKADELARAQRDRSEGWRSLNSAKWKSRSSPGC